MLGIACVAFILASNPGYADERRGPAVLNLGCSAVATGRVQEVLRDELGAVGSPWQDLTVKLRCRGLDYTIEIARRNPETRIEQGLFAEADPELDRDRWIASVILDLAESELGLARPILPQKGVLAPAWSMKKTRPESPPESAKPAPTFEEWLGPAHVGLRVGWNALNATEFVPFSDRGSLGVAGVQLVGAKILQPNLAVFANLGFSKADKPAQGADLNLTMFRVGGGVTWRKPLGRTWMFETDLGAALSSTNLTRRVPGASEVLDEDSGLAPAATLSFLLVSYYNRSRLGFGLDTGWLFGVPESAGRPFQAMGLDFVAKPLSLNGPWVGLVFHIGSAETRP